MIPTSVSAAPTRKAILNHFSSPVTLSNVSSSTSTKLSAVMVISPSPVKIADEAGILMAGITHNIKYTTSHPSNINSFFQYFSSITLDLLNITLNLYHNTLYVFTQAFRLFVLKPPYYVITSTDCAYSHRNPKHEQHCGIAICACGLPV